MLVRWDAILFLCLCWALCWGSGLSAAAPLGGAPGDVHSVRQDPDAEYRNTVQAAEIEQKTLSTLYAAAESDHERGQIINKARSFIESFIATELFPRWKGTPWSFNGTAETPGLDPIACGYFVSTVLRDVGYRVNRYTVAQQTSERIILTFTDSKHVKRFSNVRIDAFVDSVQDWGEGLYIVGLDYHVGFLLCTKDDLWFVHSAFRVPYEVVRERARESGILAGSRYRIVGSLSQNDELIRKWLLGETIPTRTE
jgi:hypothetical protein